MPAHADFTRRPPAARPTARPIARPSARSGTRIGRSLCALAALPLVLSVGSSGGCAVDNSPGIQFERRYSPDISGVIRKSGAPQPGVNLVMSLVESKSDLCYFSMLEATTDENGEFALGAVTEEDAGNWAGVLDLQWQVCIEAEDGNKRNRIPIWHDAKYGLLTAAVYTKLECDLDKPAGAVCTGTPEKLNLAPD